MPTYEHIARFTATPGNTHPRKFAFAGSMLFEGMVVNPRNRLNCMTLSASTNMDGA